MAEKRCTIRCLDPGHVPITLLDNTPLTLGRGPITKIKEARCSRTQVMLVANYAENKVKITQVGKNASGFNGVELKQNEPVEGSHGQKFDILLGQFTYIIEFDPPPGKRPVRSTSAKNLNTVSESEPEEEEDEEYQPKKRKTDEASETSQDEVTPEHWHDITGQVLIYKPPDAPNRALVAGYDLDHTIITTKSQSVFPKYESDWKIMYLVIPKKLKTIYTNGYKIVIFTNQATLINSVAIRKFKAKIELIAKELKVPIELYASTCPRFRKPGPFLWQEMEKRNGVEIDMKKSFYCGDAAGRTASTLKKADHSQADLLFARNLGLQFYVPEESFLGETEKRAPKVTAFNPKHIPCDTPLCDPENKTVVVNGQEMVLMVGCPGSGKSTFVKCHLEPSNYKTVSRDELQSMPKCLKMAEKYLKEQLSVVIDNTNTQAKQRAPFIALAKKLGVPVRALVMKADIKLMRHNLKFREIMVKDRVPLQTSVLQTFVKNFEMPKPEEGFDDIVKINFWPTFEDAEKERIYNMYLLEKDVHKLAQK